MNIYTLAILNLVMFSYFRSLTILTNIYPKFIPIRYEVCQKKLNDKIFTR